MACQSLWQQQGHCQKQQRVLQLLCCLSIWRRSQAYTCLPLPVMMSEQTLQHHHKQEQQQQQQ
jgi:hypothetical protein